MPQKLVIVGSAMLQERINYWRSFWEDKGFEITAYPAPITTEKMLEEYPNVHKNFFSQLENADVVFVMNENKNNLVGYVGAETFSEMAFVVAQNLLHDKKIKIILLQIPAPQVQAYNEISLWLKLGWITLFK